MGTEGYQKDQTMGTEGYQKKEKGKVNQLDGGGGGGTLQSQKTTEQNCREPKQKQANGAQVIEITVY